MMVSSSPRLKCSRAHAKNAFLLGRDGRGFSSSSQHPAKDAAHRAPDGRGARVFRRHRDCRNLRSSPAESQGQECSPWLWPLSCLRSSRSSIFARVLCRCGPRYQSRLRVAVMVAVGFAAWSSCARAPAAAPGSVARRCPPRPCCGQRSAARSTAGRGFHWCPLRSPRRDRPS